MQWQSGSTSGLLIIMPSEAQRVSLCRVGIIFVWTVRSFFVARMLQAHHLEASKL